MVFPDTPFQKALNFPILSNSKNSIKSGYVFPGRGLLRGKLAFSKKAGFPLNGSYLLEKA